jgi:hypothetical protein
MDTPHQKDPAGQEPAGQDTGRGHAVEDAGASGGGARRDRPLIDVGPALGEAGHETELLGYEGIADTAPVLRDAGAAEDPRDVEEQILDSMATRGVGGVT